MIVQSVSQIPTTLQGIFDHVAQHLLKQGIKCTSDIGCSYRENKDINSTVACAAGSLIPNDLYLSIYEEKKFSSIYYSLVRDGFPKLNGVCLNLITRLQTLHDCSNPNTWREELHKIAAYYSLSQAVLG